MRTIFLFSQQSGLGIYVRQHTGERPFLCHIYSWVFTSKGVLSCHCKGH